jgi:hypothetical protein
MSPYLCTVKIAWRQRCRSCTPPDADHGSWQLRARRTPGRGPAGTYIATAADPCPTTWTKPSTPSAEPADVRTDRAELPGAGHRLASGG